jgi:hypothetical protein
MRVVALGFLVLFAMCTLRCDNEGPCGDPVVQCWTYDRTLPGCDGCSSSCYQRYEGSGKCPRSYYCVDPRRPLDDGGSCLPDDLGRNND